MAAAGLSIRLDDRPRAAEDDGGDHDRFAHYVRRDQLLPALVDGSPVTALCGKRWVPSRDPSRYPVCPPCAELAPYESELG